MVSACRIERWRVSDGEMRETSKSSRRPADRGETGTDRSPRRAQARSISFWRGRSGDRRAADQALSNPFEDVGLGGAKRAVPAAQATPLPC